MDASNTLLAFILSTIAFTVAPGMDTALTLKMALAGYRAGLGTVAGICAGLLAWGAIAALGLTLLLTKYHALYSTMEWVGAAYLAYLGITIIIGSFKLEEETFLPKVDVEDSFLGGFTKGLTTDLLNPQVGVFIMTFFPQFIPHEVNFSGRIEFYTILSLINAGICFIWLGALVMLSRSMGTWVEDQRIAAWLDRIAGAAFLYFGLKLILDALH